MRMKPNLFPLLLLMVLSLFLVGCAQEGVRRDFGFTPHCLRERVWNDSKGVVEVRPVCTVPSFWQRFGTANGRE